MTREEFYQKYLAGHFLSEFTPGLMPMFEAGEEWVCINTAKEMARQCEEIKRLRDALMPFSICPICDDCSKCDRLCTRGQYVEKAREALDA